MNTLSFTATSNTTTQLVGDLDLTSATSGFYTFSFRQDTTLVTESQAFFVNENLGGTNTVSATITEGTGKNDGPGDPLVGVEIFLQDDATNNIVATEITDANGFVAFTNIPDGNYNLHIENTTNSSPLSIEVNADTDTEDLALQDNDDNLTLAINNTIFENEYKLNIYPTVFDNNIKMTLNLKEPTNIKLEVYNLIGAKIGTVNKEKEVGQVEIDLSQTFKGKVNGIYFVKTTIENNSKIIKVIKK